MMVIGLTGSIGMGKTTVGGFFERLGAPVHCADKVVGRALAPYGGAFETVALAFPSCWDKKNHVIDKQKLAALIYNDDDAREKLEAILHPVVRADQDAFVFKQKRLGREACVLDIPLLFETGAEERVDKTVVVSAPCAIQRQRVLARPGMTVDRFAQILRTQMPDAQKRALALHNGGAVIDTGLGKAHSFKQVKTLLKQWV